MITTAIPTDTLDILYSFILLSPAERNDQLLDNWAAEVIAENKYGFEDGLLGLGWLVAYLIETNHIEADADEILEDIDDTIYKLTIREIMNEYTDTNNLLQFVSYYQQRLQYQSKAHFYRRFTHFECLKLLIEKLNTSISTKEPILVKDTGELTNIMLKYSYLIKTCMSEKLVEQHFYATIEQLISLFEQEDNILGNEQALAKLLICAKQYDNPYWVDKLRSICIQNESIIKNTDKHTKRWFKIAADYPEQNFSLKEFVGDSAGEIDQLFQYITNVKQEKS